MHVVDELKMTGRFAFWTVAWAATLALAKFGPQGLWNADQRAVSWAAVAVNVAVGIGWIVAFTRFLRGLDELQRKIMQNALAVTLGAGWVAGFAYVVADAAGIARDVNIAVLPALMGGVFVLAFAAGRVHYR